MGETLHGVAKVSSFWMEIKLQGSPWADQFRFLCSGHQHYQNYRGSLSPFQLFPLQNFLTIILRNPQLATHDRRVDYQSSSYNALPHRNEAGGS